MTKIGTFTFIKAILDQQQEAIRLIDTCTVLGAESEGEAYEYQTIIANVLVKKSIQIDCEATLASFEYQLESLKNLAFVERYKDEMTGRIRAWKEAIKTLKKIERR